MTVEQARIQYETAAAAIPQIESQIAQTENLISILLGRNPGPIPRGKSILELTLPAVPAGVPSRAPRAAAGHPAGRAEPGRGQRPARRRQGAATSRPSRSPASSASRAPSSTNLFDGPGAGVELRRLDHRSALHRRRDLGPGAAGRGGAQGRAARLRGRDPERLRRRRQRPRRAGQAGRAGRRPRSGWWPRPGSTRGWRACSSTAASPPT